MVYQIERSATTQGGVYFHQYFPQYCKVQNTSIFGRPSILWTFFLTKNDVRFRTFYGDDICTLYAWNVALSKSDSCFLFRVCLLLCYSDVLLRFSLQLRCPSHLCLFYFYKLDPLGSCPFSVPRKSYFSKLFFLVSASQPTNQQQAYPTSPSLLAYPASPPILWGKIHEA